MSYAHRDSPVLAKLCTLLVENQYGELAARVFSVLARHGRQPLAAMTRSSYLNSHQIKYGLVILVQQHLVCHTAYLESDLTYYEIHWEQAYTLVRYGTILKSIESRYGKKAANVLSNLITLGHTRISDLREAYFPPDETSDREHSDDELVNGTKTNGHATNGISGKANGLTNGHADDTYEDPALAHNPNLIDSTQELDAIIHHLMLEGWVIKVDVSQYLSPADVDTLIRKEVIDEEHDGKQPTSVKGKERLTLSVNQRKRAMRDDWCKTPKFNSRKRSSADPDLAGTMKRLKQGALEWSSRDSKNTVVVMDDSLVIRLNPEKISVAMRSDQLVRLVQQRLGLVTAKIYEIMLRLIETKTPRCYETWPDPLPADPDNEYQSEINPELLVTAKDVAKKLSEPEYLDIDIFDRLDPEAVARLTKSRNPSSRVVDGRLQPPIDPRDLSSDDRARIVDCHIKKLSDDPFHFVTWHSNPGVSRWQVEFDDISKSLIQHEIENTILSRGKERGGLGVKLIRALKKKGKLDERQTCNIMMMPAADIRQIANEMTVQGFLQTQELPRVERREAKSSIHLMWYDRQRAREKLLHDTYKGMVRIIQRVNFEKEKVKDLLRKAERSDVVGNEEKWLSPAELAVLRKWKEVEEKLLLQLVRQDELVSALRDFIGPLITA